MFACGTNLLCRIPEKPHGIVMEPRWLPAVWLGKRYDSHEHIVAMEDARAVRTAMFREQPSEKYDKTLLDASLTSHGTQRELEWNKETC